MKNDEQIMIMWGLLGSWARPACMGREDRMR